MYRLATLTILALAFFLTTLPTFAQQARFEGLGTVGGSSEAYSVSGDGSVVVGGVPTGGAAFRWQGGEMVALPQVPGSVHGNFAKASSTDGSVVVGGDGHGSGFAARWQNGEVRVIHDPKECSNTNAYDVSGDGSIIVGFCRPSDTTGVQEAVRWVDGEMEGLGWFPDAEIHRTIAYGITSDGSTIVGQSTLEPAVEKAFRWTEEGGMEEVCPQEWCALAYAVSDDGSVIVGDNHLIFDPAIAVSWRWEEGVGAEQLPPPEGWIGIYVRDVSADGSIIVGLGYNEEGAPAPYIWTEEAGSRGLWEVLEDDFGLDMTGWEPYYGANGISDDGTVIVGNGINPDGIVEAWRAEAPFGQPIADEATPEALADVLSAPSPNPVHGTSTFTVAVERGQHVSVEVFDALGRQVQTVYEGALAAGMSERLTLDASALPAGVYMIRATGEDFAKTRRVTVVR